MLYPKRGRGRKEIKIGRWLVEGILLRNSFFGRRKKLVSKKKKKEIPIKIQLTPISTFRAAPY